MKPKLYKSLLYSMVGAGMLFFGKLHRFEWNHLQPDRVREIWIYGKGCRQYVCAGIFLLAQFLLGMVRVRWPGYLYGHVGDPFADRRRLGWFVYQSAWAYVSFRNRSFQWVVVKRLFGNKCVQQAVGGRGRAGIGGVCGPATCLPCVVFYLLIRPFP